MSCSQTVPLYCLQCICLDIIWANKWWWWWYNPPITWQTGGQTPRRQQRPRMRIASRGKNDLIRLGKTIDVTLTSATFYSHCVPYTLILWEVGLYINTLTYYNRLVDVFRQRLLCRAGIRECPSSSGGGSRLTNLISSRAGWSRCAHNSSGTLALWALLSAGFWLELELWCIGQPSRSTSYCVTVAEPWRCTRRPSHKVGQSLIVKLRPTLRDVRQVKSAGVRCSNSG